ncbi:MAG TPA: hypothetical protein VF041_23030 [Gemmatimonadaceae bacterium]
MADKKDKQPKSLEEVHEGQFGPTKEGAYTSDGTNVGPVNPKPGPEPGVTLSPKDFSLDPNVPADIAPEVAPAVAPDRAPPGRPAPAEEPKPAKGKK